jgi:hypothetical protein
MFTPLARIAGLAVTTALLLAAGGGALGPSMAKAQTPWVAPAPEKAKKSPLRNDQKTVEQGGGGEGDQRIPEGTLRRGHPKRLDAERIDGKEEDQSCHDA